MSPPLRFLHRPLTRWTALLLLWTVVGLVFVMQYYIFHLTEKVVFTSGRALWTVLGWYPWIVLTPLVVHLALGHGADRVAGLVQQHHLLLGHEPLRRAHAGLARLLTAAANTPGRRPAAGTSARRTGGTRVAPSSPAVSHR